MRYGRSQKRTTVNWGPMRMLTKVNLPGIGNDIGVGDFSALYSSVSFNIVFRCHDFVVFVYRGK